MLISSILQNTSRDLSKDMGHCPLKSVFFSRCLILLSELMKTTYLEIILNLVIWRGSNHLVGVVNIIEVTSYSLHNCHEQLK